jgi:hypothetical protein
MPDIFGFKERTELLDIGLRTGSKWARESASWRQLCVLSQMLRSVPANGYEFALLLCVNHCFPKRNRGSSVSRFAAEATCRADRWRHSGNCRNAANTAKIDSERVLKTAVRLSSRQRLLRLSDTLSALPGLILIETTLPNAPNRQVPRSSASIRGLLRAFCGGRNRGRGDRRTEVSITRWSWSIYPTGCSATNLAR